jgi:hypothetical protein
MGPLVVGFLLLLSRAIHFLQLFELYFSNGPWFNYLLFAFTALGHNAPQQNQIKLVIWFNFFWNGLGTGQELYFSINRDRVS